MYRRLSRGRTWRCRTQSGGNTQERFQSQDLDLYVSSIKTLHSSEYLMSHSFLCLYKGHCAHFFVLLHLISPVYNRSAQVPEHQLISRSPRQCAYFRQKAPTDGQSGAPNRGASTHVQEKCQLCQDSRAQAASAWWKHLYCSVFGNWYVYFHRTVATADTSQLTSYSVIQTISQSVEQNNLENKSCGILCFS